MPLLKDSALLAPLKGFEDLGPELVRFAEVVGEAHVCHTSFGRASHGLELRDDIFQTKGFAYGLRAACFELGVNHVNVEMVICWLVCRLVSM